ncbi:PAS domain S-box protein [Hyphomicrobium sp.]|uniref:PAS domain S-box protein n=1 Tax=Hyphomicrobium sp. TaxID=82 RepID=UPI002E3552E7|nr:PAS domain S-box protein [Hyphomicrobium sp.]HEX2841399.1 PAS domain S-box protein [Hyphomicrobium sp.]
MPLAASYKKHPLVEAVRRSRTNPLASYGIAVAAVGTAAVLRDQAGPHLTAGLPFITFYPAIIIAALIGGLWPGILAIVLSALGAWYWFLPPFGSWQIDQHAAFTLFFFVAMSCINVGIIFLLDHAVNHALAQEENVRLLIESAPTGILVVDDKGHITLVNASMERLFGYQRDEVLGHKVEMLVGRAAELRHEKFRENYMRGAQPRPMGEGQDLFGRRKDGSEFPVEIGLNPIQRSGVSGVLATLIDITERKQASQMQQLVIRELSHRTKNLFSVVQAVANQSFDQDRAPAEAKQIFNGRLNALANAYAAVSNSQSSASLREIMQKQFSGFSDRITIHGCDVLISPWAAQHFALIAHELATNAVKYGSLGTPDGRVVLEGTVERGATARVRFVWRELGGPAAPATTRKGFGSVILFDMASHWAEQATAQYEETGLRYTLVIPLPLVEAVVTDTHALHA